MSSILTNSSAMVALETLRGINKNLGMVQSEISTGKSISNAKDNAAIWAISTVMSTDVESFDQISNSLNLGSATVGVARASSEQVTDLLQDMKQLIVSAQEENVDRTKIQTDVAELVTQIGSIVAAAQFNGQNLLNSTGSISILSSLDRAADGTVTASSISVSRVNLGTGAEVVAATALAAADGANATATGAAIPVNDGTNDGTQTVTLSEGVVETGTVASVTVDGTEFTYTSVAGDTNTDVANGLKAAYDAAPSNANISVAVTAAADPLVDDAVLTFSNTSTTVAGTLAAGSLKGGVAAGALEGITSFDVTTDAGAASALAEIEGFLQTAIDASAAFGSKQKRIENQVEFVATLTDSLKVGIGALTDANLEEASARLQSLQVQQQLGVQALSIANQGPQQLLALFR
ncbi:MAG: flagellin [Acidimicrobiales bacterium]|nr:flagellin [Hyphomonadaceae bacterium]RZV44771.1 MAG: flagellin [Acidimicrobiales bacterium]